MRGPAALTLYAVALLGAMASYADTALSRGGGGARYLPAERMVEYYTGAAGARAKLLVDWNGKAKISGRGVHADLKLSCGTVLSVRDALRKIDPQPRVHSRDGRLRDLLYWTRRPPNRRKHDVSIMPAPVSFTVWPPDSHSGRGSPAVSDRNWRIIRRLDRLVQRLRRKYQ